MTANRELDTLDLIDDRPTWLDDRPEPHREKHTFNRKPYSGWTGVAPLDWLTPWIDNPRIDVPVENWRKKHHREPTNLDLLDIMHEYSAKSPVDDETEEESASSRRSHKNSLEELAKSIALNGVRVPLIVTSERLVLDGNRRYFASLWLSEYAKSEEDRAKYRRVPVWVLPSGLSPTQEDAILVELNAINDCFVKWPYSVTARRIYEDFLNGMTPNELAEKYHNYDKGRINQTIEAAKVANEFIERQNDAPEAKDLAYRHLIWFDELKRSNSKAMVEPEFKEGVFDLIAQGENRPFSSHAEFKGLEPVYRNPEAWKVLTESESKEGLRKARFIVERTRYEDHVDANSKMERVNKLLEGVIDGPGFALVDECALDQFRALSRKVPGLGSDVESQLQQAVQVLDGLTSKQLAGLPVEMLELLEQVLGRVTRQARASGVGGDGPSQ